MVNPGQPRKLAHSNGPRPRSSTDPEPVHPSPLYPGLPRMSSLTPGPPHLPSVNPGPPRLSPVNPGPPRLSPVNPGPPHFSSVNSGPRPSLLDQEPSLLSCLNLGPSCSSSLNSAPSNSLSGNLGPPTSSSVISSAKRKCSSKVGNVGNYPNACNNSQNIPSNMARLPRMMFPKPKSRLPSFTCEFSQVPLLTKLSMECILANLKHLRMDGLPTEIGISIFKACNERGFFTHQNRSSEINFDRFVGSFGSRAVGNLVLSGVYLRPYIAQHDSFLMRSLRFVTELDMSNCCLVDDEVLMSFAFFECLQILNLANNYLSKEGLKIFLLRQELFKDGFKNLRVLDLRYNHLFKSNLSTVLSFPKLERLQFSVCTDGIERKHVDLAPSAARVTFFVPTAPSKKTVEEYLREAGFEYNAKPFEHSFQDCGFLIPSLKRWMEEFPQTCKSPRQFGGKELLCRNGLCTEEGTESIHDERSVFFHYCAVRYVSPHSNGPMFMTAHQRSF